MKNCKKCNVQMDDDEMFCPECGAKYEEDMKAEESEKAEDDEKEKARSSFLKTKGKKLIIVAGVILILVIAGIASGFFSGFKRGYDGAIEKASHESEDTGSELQRVSKEYQYNFICGDVPSYADWFVQEGEIFVISDETLYHLNQEEGSLEEIGELGNGKCVPASGENNWLVFTDGKYAYKYNIQNKTVDAFLEAEGLEIFGSAAVVNDILYYYSEKERIYWDENARQSEEYVPSFSGSEYSIWSYDLMNDKDEKLIEYVSPETKIVIDPLDDQYFYFDLWLSGGASLTRYNCETKEVESMDLDFDIEEGCSAGSAVPYNGQCYVFGRNVFLVEKGKETYLCENPGYDSSKVMCSGNYIICNSDSMDKITVFEGENVYEIEKTWGKDWSFGQGDVIFAQNGVIWLMEWSDSDTQVIFSVDFSGNLSDTKEWITLEGGKFVAYFDDNLWVLGEPKEDWEIDKPVDDLVVAEIEAQGYDVQNIGQFENGKTELTMNVGEYGLYRIPLEEKENVSVSNETDDTQSQESKLYQQKKEIDQQKENQTQNEQNSSKKIADMFANFRSFDSVWGDFGAHVNEYQGMVESTINSFISMSDYFGDVDNVYMSLTKVIDNDDVLMNGLSATNQYYLIHFEGPSPTGGMYRTLECTIYSPDGVKLIYQEDSYY